MELTARAAGDPNAGAVLRGAMALTAFGPGGDGPGDGDHSVTLVLPSQRPMIFQDSEVGMWDGLDVLQTAVDNAVDHGFLPKGANMLCDVIFCTHLGAFRRPFLIDPPASVEPMMVRLQLGDGWCGRSLHENLIAYREMWQLCRDCRSVMTKIGVEVA